MSMIIPRVQPIERLPKSKHSTEDPNERRRRQLLLTYGYNATAETPSAFSRVLRDTVEISEEGRRALAKMQQKTK